MNSAGRPWPWKLSISKKNAVVISISKKCAFLMYTPEPQIDFSKVVYFFAPLVPLPDADAMPTVWGVLRGDLSQNDIPFAINFDACKTVCFAGCLKNSRSKQKFGAVSGPREGCNLTFSDWNAQCKSGCGVFTAA